MLKMQVWYLLLLLPCLSVKAQSRRFSHLQLVSTVLNDLPHENVVICPPAIDLALTQLYLAARGDTESELKSVLGYTGAAKTGLLNERIKAWTSQENPTTRIASRFYTSRGLRLKPHHNFDTDFLEVSATGMAKINKWVTANTERSLEDMIDPTWFEDSLRVFLVNAISFSGLWKYKFQPAADGIFYVADEGVAKPVKMMKVVGPLSYYFQRQMDCHVVTLPYAKSRMSMVLLIPRTSVGIQKIEANLHRLDVSKAVPRTLSLTLPQFKFRYTFDVVQSLIDLKVNKNVFDQANLSDLIVSNERVKVDGIMHSVFIEVGLEASNLSFATGAQVSERAAVQTVTLIGNRPFMFGILDRQRIHFFGRYSHPV